MNKNGLIIQKLDGGLGNQLFQYAFCYALSRKTGKDLKVFSFYNDIMPGTRKNAIKYFKIEEACRRIPLRFYAETIECYLRAIFNFLFKTCYITNFDWNRTNDYIEYVLENNIKVYQNINISRCKKYYVVEGFWQSPLYFDEYREEILQLFNLKRKYQDKINNKLIFKVIKHDPRAVSIHVRRGDYSIIGWTLTPNYYQEAIKCIKEKINNPVFYVFSDDINWCRNYFKAFDEKFVFVEAEKNKQPYEDMYLMSQCRNNIIANSTYSWWAAYLNNFPSKIVIAPKEICNCTNKDILNANLGWYVI